VLQVHLDSFSSLQCFSAFAVAAKLIGFHGDPNFGLSAGQKPKPVLGPKGGSTGIGGKWQ